ncbi:actin-binding Rho-activating protein [Pimephales promelas]|uniref:actin-binding Rho-activating protein n=1 Tax=Pimephales promelas TaxID=90988 RepID=UPI001955CBA9|nr:actin-binding Rho-activating protein [Pimephales promelas]KAG1963236.1 Costars domain-containing protein [Pimephales promelas]
MSTAAVQPNQSLSRAVRKIKVASAVNSLAKSWQSWANKHTDQQDTIPSGWMPDTIIEDEKEKQKEKSEMKLLVTPRVVSENSEDCEDDQIKTVSVTKAITPKCNEYGKDQVSIIKDKINTNQLTSEDTKNFLGNESPTRRRYCGWKAGNFAKTTGSRSSSLDAEDSGLGEEASLSDTSDQNENEPKKHVTRHKIKITTMNDLKSRWQQFAKEHIEGQKLNPFSEEFDYEHAMATRLQKGDTGYGRPKEGSKTAQRADRAQKHIYREMDEMCFIIRDMGQINEEGLRWVTFGRLFDRYVKISDKVVGILLRCRKHKMVDFEGEMLWKGQDDDVIITLLV